MVALPEVAGADLDRPVRQAERGDQPLGAGEQLVEQLGALLRRGDGEDLDLVELVGPQHAAGVLAGRPGLPPVARRVRHQPHRQLGLVEDLVAVDRRQRHLGGRDRPQLVALDGEGVVGELRRGDPIAVSVAVVTSDGGRISSKASALRSRASWHSARPIVAPRPRVIVNIEPLIFVGPLVVEDAEGGGRLPVRHALVLGELGRAGRTVRGRPGCRPREAPSGASGWGRLGMASRTSRSSAATRVVLVGELPLLLAERPALRRQLVGAGGVAGAAALADLLGQLVDLRRGRRPARR